MDSLCPVYSGIMIEESAEKPGQELSSDEWLTE
jgi:hypothetical protein